MSTYQHVKLSEAYKLINHSPVLLVSTVSEEWKYNIAPIAWSSPVEYEPVTKVLIVCDKESKTSRNILYSKAFTISIPSIEHIELVKKLGSISGNEVDKMTLNFDHFPSIQHGNPVPTHTIAFIDIKLTNIIDEGTVNVLIGEAIAAQVLTDKWDGKNLIIETTKTLHHTSGNKFATITEINE